LTEYFYRILEYDIIDIILPGVEDLPVYPLSLLNINLFQEVTAMKFVKGLYYTKEHDWLKVEGNKAYIGITDYAQHELGDIVYVELPEIDTEFAKGDVYGVVESVKAASDLLIPVDGKVLEINESLVDEPGLINEAPYENWIAAVELKDKDQLEDLLSTEEYKDLLSEEE
jgi:glycine cleavage system H protein